MDNTSAVPILLRCSALTLGNSGVLTLYYKWSTIQRFFDVLSGPLSLLRTLEILAVDGGLEGVNFPPSPLFGDAISLKFFSLFVHVAPHLDRFVFPNLATFNY